MKQETTYELRSRSGKNFFIAKEWVRLGRSSDNDICIKDPALSRHHLNFYLKNDLLIVEDAGSANGFSVNGQLIKKPTYLKAGDRLSIGHKIYTVYRAGENKTPEAPYSIPYKQRNTQTASVLENNGSKNKKIRLYIILFAIFGAFYFLSQDNKKTKTAKKESQDVRSIDLKSLANDSYSDPKFTQKSLTEIQSEAKFREALRDYDNAQYSRALIGFNEALTLNPGHPDAALYIEYSNKNIDEIIQNLIKQGQKNFKSMQYRATKIHMMQILSILSEEVPGYSKKISQESIRKTASETVIISRSQEETLLDLPCSQTEKIEICEFAINLTKKSRERLGEEDVLK